jgi:hypothetical protein
VSVSPSLSPSISPSLSPSISPSISPGYQLYSRGDYGVLPVDNSDLEVNYSGQDVIDVAEKDDVRVAQTGTQEYMLHQFKDYVAINTCSVECELQSTQAPSVSTVYLQIYNLNTDEWDTIDSDNTSNADTDFTLSASIVSLTDYKDENNLISCRVYQEAV